MTYIYKMSNKGILLYCGSTDDYIRRWKEHKAALSKGKHSNKTLQKYFISNNLSIEELQFEVLYSLDTDNSLVRYTLEMFVISLLRPCCNRCVIQQGNKMMTFAKADKDISKKVVDAIINQ